MILLKIENVVIMFLLSVVRVISASVNVVFIYNDKSINTPKRDIVRRLVLFLLERKSCFDRMSLLKWFARRTGVISAYDSYKSHQTIST